MKSLDERTHTFVVRIWQERRELSEGSPTWRARVDDIRAGSRTYFTSLEQLLTYLSGRTETDVDLSGPPVPIGGDLANGQPASNAGDGVAEDQPALQITVHESGPVPVGGDLANGRAP
jgi:hypothetical protein